jgi:hypothetical protein
MASNLTLSALGRAIESRDAAALNSFYAENATMNIIDRDHPPSRPQMLVGRPSIAAYFDDVCGRAMTHHLENGFVDDSHLAFTQACAYPDGTRVFCSAMADLENGKITKQTIVQAWDA